MKQLNHKIENKVGKLKKLAYSNGNFANDGLNDGLP